MPLCHHKHDKRAKQCHSCRLRNNPARLGTGQGWVPHSTGYLIGYVNGRAEYQHRFVMEQYIGRKLYRDEQVHHIDHNRTNNRPENLELLLASDHGKEHMNSQRAKSLSILGHKKRWNYVS